MALNYRPVLSGGIQCKRRHQSGSLLTELHIRGRSGRGHCQPGARHVVGRNRHPGRLPPNPGATFKMGTYPAMGGLHACQCSYSQKICERTNVRGWQSPSLTCRVTNVRDEMSVPMSITCLGATNVVNVTQCSTLSGTPAVTNK